jgi:hydrogenase maturation protein HypF
MIVRRARGSVPASMAVTFEFAEPVLACGAHLKNTVCLGADRNVVLGPHVGDLDHFDTLQAFRQSVETLKRFAGLDPAVIVHDLHPDYVSTKYALAQEHASTVGVQHHHAHIAGVIAEHRTTGPVIGVAFDGTGYGTDGQLWGGEFLIADRADFVRAAHLEYVPLPGGDQAIRQPWRMGAVYLQRAFGTDFFDLDLQFVRRVDPAKWRLMSQMIDSGLNCPRTSSMGRLFDAVAAIVLHRDAVSFEGQAAMELEAIADAGVTSGYGFDLLPGEPAMIDPLPVIRGVVEDVQAGVAASTIAGRFHFAVAAMIVARCEGLREARGLCQVALSGGVFQNGLLTKMTLTRLREAGFLARTGNRVPVNDGGIAFGQAAVAAARLEKS